jgi:MFS transporter, Spinster family, sphingosine-1-phosphate transporter
MAEEPATSFKTRSTESLSAPLPGARAALVLLLAINLFNYIDRQVLSSVVENIKTDLPKAVLPAWAEHLLGSHALLGLLAMAFMATYMLTAPIFGWMAERVSRWWLVGIGVGLWSLASGASGLATTFGILFLTRCFVGIGEGAYGPIAPDMISDLYPVQIRGRVLAWFYMAIPVGSALGYVLGGTIADLLNWRWAFWLVVPPGLLLAGWCWFMKEPPRGYADLGGSSPSRSPQWSDYLILLKTPSYVLVTLGMTAMTFAIGGIAFWMPYYIHVFRDYGESQGFVSTTFGAIVVVAGLGATLLGGYVGDKLRPRFPGSYFLVSGIAMLIGLPFSIAMLYVPFPWAWVFIFLACFCLFFNTGPTNTILANVSHPSIRASAFALNILVIHALGDVISPLIIGAITDLSGDDMNLAFLVVSGMIFVGGLLWLWGTKYLEQDTKMAPLRMGS